MEKKVETTIVYRDYIGMLENEIMETTIYNDWDSFQKLGGDHLEGDSVFLTIRPRSCSKG